MLKQGRESWNAISAKKDDKQGLVSFNLDRKGKKKQARSRNMDHYAMQDYVS